MLLINNQQNIYQGRFWENTSKFINTCKAKASQEFVTLLQNNIIHNKTKIIFLLINMPMAADPAFIC